MHLNQFSLRIAGGHETSSGYVELRHGQQYRIVLRNDRSVPCDAEVLISGKSIGVFRLCAHAGLTLERMPDDDGCFTFCKVGTTEADACGIDAGHPDIGLVQAVFTPQKAPLPITVIHEHHHHYWPKPWQDRPWYTITWDGTNNPSTGVYRCTTANAPDQNLAATLTTAAYEPGAKSMPCSAAYEAGDTVLSGHSDQQFVSVGALDLDYEQQTTISLRLVAGDVRQMRPLLTRGNPVPPHVA